MPMLRVLLSTIALSLSFLSLSSFTTAFGNDNSSELLILKVAGFARDTEEGAINRCIKEIEKTPYLMQAYREGKAVCALEPSGDKFYFNVHMSDTPTTSGTLRVFIQHKQHKGSIMEANSKFDTVKDRCLSRLKTNLDSGAKLTMSMQHAGKIHWYCNLLEYRKSVSFEQKPSLPPTSQPTKPVVSAPPSKPSLPPPPPQKPAPQVSAPAPQKPTLPPAPQKPAPQVSAPSKPVAPAPSQPTLPTPQQPSTGHQVLPVIDVMFYADASRSFFDFPGIVSDWIADGPKGNHHYVYVPEVVAFAHATSLESAAFIPLPPTFVDGSEAKRKDGSLRGITNTKHPGWTLFAHTDLLSLHPFIEKDKSGRYRLEIPTSGKWNTIWNKSMGPALRLFEISILMKRHRIGEHEARRMRETMDQRGEAFVLTDSEKQTTLIMASNGKDVGNWCDWPTGIPAIFKDHYGINPSNVVSGSWGSGIKREHIYQRVKDHRAKHGDDAVVFIAGMSAGGREIHEAAVRLQLDSQKRDEVIIDYEAFIGSAKKYPESTQAAPRGTPFTSNEPAKKEQPKVSLSGLRLAKEAEKASIQEMKLVH